MTRQASQNVPSFGTMYNSIEQELWRIFTFYAIHADPTTPETWRPVIFLRFCKECQIISRSLPSNAVELEITKLSRIKLNGTEFNPTILLSFTDFLQLLNILAVRVYPKDSSETACTRLIFENVLLLANRRVPTNHMYDLQNEGAIEVVTGLFGKALYNIFKHYLNKADARRQHAVTNEKIKQKQLAAQLNLSPTLVPQSPQLITLKEIAKTQKDVFSFKEYVQFCQDYSLKSTSLLTAIEVGEIFLNLVPLPAPGAKHSELSMTFDLFLRALIYMSQVAYRDAAKEIEPQNKVKALLLYMWKTVNDTTKTKELLKSSRSSNITSMAGSYNYFGAGLFSDQFLANWAKEGYPEYTTPPESKAIDGRNALAAAGSVGTGTGEEEEGGSGTGGDDTEETKSMTSTPSTAKRGGNGAGTVATKSGGFGLESSTAAGGGGGSSAAIGNLSLNLNTDADFKPVRPKSTPCLLRGRDIVQLLRLKPELAEFLYLEIENMKLHKNMSRSSQVAEEYTARRMLGTSPVKSTAL